jgi:23S rRNA (uracil1939-C5)-methyltransferase
MLTPGQMLSLVVEKPAAGGRMIARVDGQVVLVAGAIPGERVRARVERVRKDVAFAETVSVDESSPDRREPFADPLCGGCLYSHIAYPRQLEIKSQVIADAFGRIGHVTLPASVPVIGSPEEGYRMRARLHHRGYRLGFFREATHDICEPRPTRQLLAPTCDALDRLVAALRSLTLDAVREVEIAENAEASERAISVGLAARVDPRALEPVARTEGISGLVSPLGTFGNPYVTDQVALEDSAPVVLRRHAASFFQGNRHLLRDFVSHVVQQVPAEGELIDLYAGVGLFSVCGGVARGVRTTAVEGDRIAASDLAFNAAASGADVTTVFQPVEEFVGRFGRTTPRGSSPSAVIVDPPRTGLSPLVLAGLLHAGARRIVYVSCDVATLARDSRKILEAGYSIHRADAFDLFPNTPHIETVVVFDLTQDWR